MRVLIVKMSSLGDVVHTLPALSDAVHAYPDIRFDWVVEEAFSEIPTWHPAVDQVIPIALRRWRRSILKTILTGEWKRFYSKLMENQYDYVIDAQGLLKSAVITKMAKGSRIGLDRHSLTEPWARFAYQRRVFVNPQQHAVTRTRQLFAQALNYDERDSEPNYGITLPAIESSMSGQLQRPYVIFLHGTTWKSKHWPVENWSQLAGMLAKTHYTVYLPWSNDKEYSRAERLAVEYKHVRILPRLNLSQLAQVISGATALVSVDTGLAHLAVALNKPTIALYGPTQVQRIGIQGEQAICLFSEEGCLACDRPICKFQKTQETSDCLNRVSPLQVWQRLSILLNCCSQGIL